MEYLYIQHDVEYITSEYICNFKIHNKADLSDKFFSEFTESNYVYQIKKRPSTILHHDTSRIS